MDVMAEANEQPALLNQPVDEGKKTRRSRNAAGARKPSTAKSGVRRTKRPIKQQEPHSAENNNNSGQDALQEELHETNSQISLPLPPAGEKIIELDVPAPDRNSADSNEAADHSATTTAVAPRFLEAPPAVETQKYEPVFGEGLIEVSGKGFGFLRDPKRNYTQSPQAIFVTPEGGRKHALRDGLWIKGEIRRGSRGPQLFKLTQINGEDPEKYRNLPVFEELTSINPLERIRLETVPDRYTTRVMDLMTPIGKGQRGLIVAPPRTGKTTLLQHIADAVVRNHPETSLIILLVDERPEEVTEIRRTVPKADIMASSNDSDIKSHTRIPQLPMDRPRRLEKAN